MFGRLIPKEVAFFDYFEQHTALIIEATKELLALAQPGADIAAHAGVIEKLEHEADRLTHACMTALQSTFITPFDRTHIHELMSGLDDIIDTIDGAASRMVTYEISALPPDIASLTPIIRNSVSCVADAVSYLRDQKHHQAVENMCITINSYENEADGISKSVMRRLFRQEQNAIELIKWKEIVELLEAATDRCEDAADIIRAIVIEAS